jgi:hypothetical protein
MSSGRARPPASSAPLGVLPDPDQRPRHVRAGAAGWRFRPAGYEHAEAATQTPEGEPPCVSGLGVVLGRRGERGRPLPSMAAVPSVSGLDGWRPWGRRWATSRPQRPIDCLGVLLKCHTIWRPRMYSIQGAWG